MKEPKRRKSCFTFIKLDQKCESPGFQSTCTKGLEAKYLLRSNCCQVPSVVSSLNSHLLKRAMFLRFRSCIPSPPWSFGWERMLHLTRRYIFLVHVTLPKEPRAKLVKFLKNLLRYGK